MKSDVNISVSDKISVMLIAVFLFLSACSVMHAAAVSATFLLIAVFFVPPVNNYLFQIVNRLLPKHPEVKNEDKVRQILLNIFIPFMFLIVGGMINEASLTSASNASMRVNNGVLTGEYTLNLASSDTPTAICDDVVREIWKALNDHPNANTAKIEIVLHWKNKYGEEKTLGGNILVLNEESVSEFRRYQDVSSLFSDMTGVAYKSVLRQMPDIISGMINN